MDENSLRTPAGPKKKGVLTRKQKASQEKQEEFEPPSNPHKRANAYLTRSHDKIKHKNNNKSISVKQEENEEEDETDEELESPIVKKVRLRKFYEPIVENNRVYRYEDDPYEYKRVRKKIQNRESATRVRNRKKLNTFELKEKINLLEKEMVELKAQNATLSTENTMLKEHVTFLEKVLMEKDRDRTMDLDNFLMFSPKIS